MSYEEIVLNMVELLTIVVSGARRKSNRMSCYDYDDNEFRQQAREVFQIEDPGAILKDLRLQVLRGWAHHISEVLRDDPDHEHRTSDAVVFPFPSGEVSGRKFRIMQDQAEGLPTPNEMFMSNFLASFEVELAVHIKQWVAAELEKLKEAA